MWHQFRSLLIFSLVIVLSSCASLNKQLSRDRGSDPGYYDLTEWKNYDFAEWLDGRIAGHKLDDTFVVMTFSGGGVRASALSYAVVDELQKFVTQGRHDLGHDIGFISSVSGGSVTAAQIALNGVESMQYFPNNFSYSDNTFYLILNLINPVGDAFVLNPFVNRATGLQSYFSRRLYGDATFQQMGRKDRPFVVLNATNMSSGFVFPFVQKTFSDICSDLNKFPVAAAVTASAAYPLFLQPVPLTNYSADGNCRRTRDYLAKSGKIEGSEKFNVLYAKATQEKYIDSAGFRLARNAKELRRDNVNPQLPTVDYIHLLDGGLTDNLGVRSVMANFDQATLKKLKTAGVKNLLYIVVNAHAQPIHQWIDDNKWTPYLTQVATAVASAPIDSTTSASTLLVEREFERFYTQDEAKGDYPDFYPVQVAFDLLDDPDLEDRSNVPEHGGPCLTRKLTT